MILIHCMTTLKDIWPVMTLFYDYNMLFIEKIYDTETFVIFFSKSSKQVHKVMTSKYSIKEIKRRQVRC